MEFVAIEEHFMVISFKVISQPNQNGFKRKKKGYQKNGKVKN